MKELWGQGDQGKTSLYNRSIEKDSLLIMLLGAVDELSANIGYLMCYLEGFSQQKVQLSEILKDLFSMSALLGEAPQAAFDFRRVKLLEAWTLEINQQLKPVKKFIMPIGNRASCYANICRTVARRAETCFFAYYHMEKQHGDIGAYLNRLSDYLFVVTRLINAKFDLEDYYK